MSSRAFKLLELSGRFALAAFLSSFSLIIVSAQSTVPSGKTVSLEISSSRNTYQLGELIVVETKIKNKTSKPIEVGGDAPNGAFIKIASGENGEFKMYVPPPDAEFILDGVNVGVTIGPHKTYKQTASILWNLKPEISHLNADAAKPFTEGRILSDYAISVAGTYFIKYCFTTRYDGGHIEIDSEPIKIVVNEPAADDLLVWNIIKNDGRIGYLLQKGDIPRDLRYKNEPRMKFMQKIDQIIIEHPNGLYTQTLRHSFDSFKDIDAKQNEALRKLLKISPQ